jgi:hypothetical protein
MPIRPSSALFPLTPTLMYSQPLAEPIALPLMEYLAPTRFEATFCHCWTTIIVTLNSFPSSLAIRPAF